MMKILVLGAGLSSSSLIKYLMDHSAELDWHVTVGDISKALAAKKLGQSERGRAIHFDVHDEAQRSGEIQQADVVVSMLPASMHILVARSCIQFKKHLVTASYVSDEIRALDQDAREAGILLLNEIGVDPGIDHMSAMEIIDRIREQGGKLFSFESATGGLVAPECDDNPWNYKFTWNPRNVVVAGQGVSKYLQRGKIKYIPYHRLFKRVNRVQVQDVGEFEIYPNRDSLKYRQIYGLDDIKTLFRGTMRRPGYSEAWDVFVQLGLTDDTYVIDESENMTYRDFLNCYLAYQKNVPVETKLSQTLGIEEDSEIMRKLIWSGIFERTPIGLKRATPAQILQHLIEPRWQLKPEDRDMIVMRHVFDYAYDETEKRLEASLVVRGTDQVHTAMSITVGIPVAIATKLLLQNRFKHTGVQLPVHPDIYHPVLRELADYGVSFVEQETLLS